MEYITQYLESMSPNDMCALFMIDMDNLEEIRSSSGEDAATYAIRSVSHMLSSLFRATDKITQTGESEFIVFIYGAISEKTVSEKAKLLCESLQFAVSTDPLVNLPVSVGVYISSGNRRSYEELAAGAREALLEAKKHGSGASFFVKTDDRDDSGRMREDGSSGFMNVVTLPVLLQNMDSGVSLLEAGDSIRYTYVSQSFYEILGLGKEAIAIPCSLTELGIHPDDLEEYAQLIRDCIRENNAISHIQRVAAGEDTWRWRRVRTVRLSSHHGSRPMLLEISSDITELMEDEQHMKENAERLKVVFEQTPSVLWEVDIPKRILSLYDVNTQSRVDEMELTNYPDTLIDRGIIHPDSIELFRSFAEGILNGNEVGHGNFIVRANDNGRYEWIALSYHMMYGRDGLPYKAVGIQEKLPVNTGFPGRPLPEAVRHYLLTRIRVDLTADSVEELWMEGMDRTAWVRGMSFFSLMHDRRNWLFMRGEGDSFQKRYSRDSLLEAYRRGERWSSMVHRCIDAGGNIFWMEETINLLRDSRTNHIHMFVCFVDIRQRHEWESLFGDNIERSGTGGMYSLSSARALTEKLIHEKVGRFCAMAVIYVGGEEAYAKKEAVLSGQSINESLGVAISLALGPGCLVSWYTQDMVLAFFPIVKSKYAIRRQIEESFSYVRATADPAVDVSALHFCAGVMMEPVETASFDAMLARTSVLCSSWKNSAIDAVAFADENYDWMWNSGEEMFEQPDKADRIQYMLSGDGKKAAFDCVAALFSADSLEDGMKGVLRCIGMHYQAERTYLIVLSENGTEVIMLYEWTSQGKNSIRQAMLGRDVEEIYVFKSCLKKQEPVFVKKTSVRVDRQEPWYFMAYPLLSGHQVKAILCVENASVHCRSDALVRVVEPFIQKEQERFHARNSKAVEIGSMADRLPNLHDYMQSVYALNSDNFSSMGALSVNVPNFSLINSSRGFQYGREMLENITGDLESIFGKSHMYRIWDAEFVVLYPDTIHESFIARCARLRTRIQRRYPGQIQIGYTWSDGIFQAKSLVREAQAIMKCDSVVRILGRDGFEPYSQLNGGGSDEVHIMKYVPYFQPKIDMRNGRLTGAEALVRGIDEDGNIVMPNRFIETLEKSGGIRELDFFMLENVMKQLSQWKSMGYPEICVSVNISRRTLFSPTALASVLAIESRYPDVSPEQIELEITETAGDVETTTLSGVLDRFKEYQIEFELDDFGSRYANIAIFSNIRFKAIKLDRSLINDLPVNDISKMMVENIVSICRSFGMECIAEGVESRQHEEILLRAGCTCGQGYYYSRPIPSGKFEQKYFLESAT